MSIPRIIIIFTFILSDFSCPFSVSYGDNIVLKDGTREKGLILDEYKDRVVVSTVDGEKTFMKSDIRYAIYDKEEKTLLQKARNFVKKKYYVKAYYAFEKVLDLDPTNIEAREKVKYLKSYLESRNRFDVMEDIRGKNAPKGETMDAEKKIYKEFGITLSDGEKYVWVKEVRKDTRKKGSTTLMAGDRIVSVWGELAAYMDVQEVAGMLTIPGEVRLAVEREVRPVLSSEGSLISRILVPVTRKVAGADLRLQKRGITISRVYGDGPFDKAGVLTGDVIWRINGKNTRYMPLSCVRKIIRENSGRDMEIDIRRDMTLWER